MPSARLRLRKMNRHITARDIFLLRALDWGPKTARQLLKLSTTWSEPFIALRTIRQRLQYLSEARLLKTYRYAGIGLSGQEQYYVATRTAYRLLFGPDETPPTNGYAAPVGLARQPHTRALSDFLIHTIVAAHRHGLAVEGVCRENYLKLEGAGDSIRPDSALEIVLTSGLRLRYFIELDCGTETIHSDTARVSIAKKLRVYDAVRDTGPRFHVLFVCTSRARMQHILASVPVVQKNLERKLFLATTLYDYLGSGAPLSAPVMADHRFEPQSLIPPQLTSFPIAADRVGHDSALPNLVAAC